jgi:hypothetical protein
MPFSRLRVKKKLRLRIQFTLLLPPAGIDLFLTGDKQLMGWMCRAFSLLRISIQLL